MAPTLGPMSPGHSEVAVASRYGNFSSLQGPVGQCSRITCLPFGTVLDEEPRE